MQTRFFNHILKFFSAPSRDEVPRSQPQSPGSDAGLGCVGDAAGTSPDVPVLLQLLHASGFLVKYSDKSDWGGTTHGCRVIVMCKRSGTRVVLDGEGPCTCPSESGMGQLLDAVRAGPPASRAPSPTPSTAGMLEDPMNGLAARDVPEAPAPLARQRTWSRDDLAKAESAEARPAGSPRGSRRLSAPPAQSAWATFDGDELNVMAATDLLQEAMSLLAGVKKVNLRNTPLVSTRRVAANVPRRASSGTFAVPLRPLSRASSSSSGLASSRSTSSLQSVHSDTPRPVKPAGSDSGGAAAASGGGLRGPGPASVALRRTVSASVGSAARTGTPAARTKSEAAKRGTGESNVSSARTLISRVPSLLKAPTAGLVNKGTARTPLRSGIKTNASLPVTKSQPARSQPAPTQAPLTCPQSPERESIKL